MSTNTQSSLLWKVLGVTGLVLGLAALIVSIAIASGDEPSGNTATQYGPEQALMKGAEHEEEEHAPDPDAPVEEYERPDPTLPDVPQGEVKRFALDVSERLTRVSDEKPALRVWSYSVNGTKLAGTGGSPPIVVNEGDRVEIALTNGSSESMEVHFPHSFDTHASEVSPQEAYRDAKPGKTVRFSFVAKHPGVYMYHCGTKPVLRHVGSGMAGLMVVRPRGLPKVDRELWLTQQEFYLGEPGGDASVDKMVAKTPDVIAFNGFASQYLKTPIPVKRGERIRMWVVNAGPSISSSFHVIGTVFDRVWSEGDLRKHSQTMALGPAEGGFVEFTLDAEGTFPFVTHAFGDMVRGAIGALKTANAPAGAPKSDSMPGMGHSEMEAGHGEEE
jgi:nitrite reductase (NO-forming)